MTQEQTRRTIEALAETRRLLDREMRYLPQNRKEKQIAFYNAHITKLNAMLRGETVEFWTKR